MGNATLVFGNVKAVAAYAGATISTNTTTTSTVVVDALGFREVVMSVYTGTCTDGTYVTSVLETDNADGTTGAAAATTVVAYTIVAADDNVVRSMSAKLTKRYCTLTFLSAGVTTGLVIKSATAILGNGTYAPVLNQG